MATECAACRNTPGLLFTAAFALYALAPAAVYLLPDSSNGFIAAQVCEWPAIHTCIPLAESEALRAEA